MYRSGDRPVVVFTVTVAETMAFFRGQIQYLIDSGFEVVVVCSPGWEKEAGTRYYPVKMEREISLFKDLISLIGLIKLLLILKPDMINAGTPKASFLMGIAAFITRVPIRIYMCHGLRLETTKGWKRKILFLAECITARCATRVCCVSHSIKKRLLELKIVHSKKVDVIGFGSVNGIDLKKFHPELQKVNRELLLKQYAIPNHAKVIGFIGRLTKDKGIPEAIDAFIELKQSFENIFLVLVGKFEQGDPLPKKTLELIKNDPAIVLTGFINHVEAYYHMFDLLWLPSHREGMGAVLLEAAASKLPVVACQITGCVDAVDDGKTGYLVPVGDSKALTMCTEKLLLDKELAEKMGHEGRKWVEERFDQQKVWANSKLYYQELLKVSLEKKNLYQCSWSRAMKRVMDLLVSIIGLTILSPLIIAVAVLVFIKLGNPVIFRQVRPGLYGQPFSIYKFRTMTEKTDPLGNLLPDELRITPFGNFLRMTSLDELPQLFNLLQGDISLVGPRPLLLEYLPLYSLEQARRHNVKPGITGWAQVNGRNEISWEEKFILDIWYVENQSFWLDVKILWLTLQKVYKKEGINQRGYATMKKFAGSKQCRDY